MTGIPFIDSAVYAFVGALLMKGYTWITEPKFIECEFKDELTRIIPRNDFKACVKIEQDGSCLYENNRVVFTPEGLEQLEQDVGSLTQEYVNCINVNRTNKKNFD